MHVFILFLNKWSYLIRSLSKSCLSIRIKILKLCGSSEASSFIKAVCAPNYLRLYIHARAHSLGRLQSRRILSAAPAIIIKHKDIATFSPSILHPFIQNYDGGKIKTCRTKTCHVNKTKHAGLKHAWLTHACQDSPCKRPLRCFDCQTLTTSWEIDRIVVLFTALFAFE